MSWGTVDAAPDGDPADNDDLYDGPYHLLGMNTPPPVGRQVRKVSNAVFKMGGAMRLWQDTRDFMRDLPTSALSKFILRSAWRDLSFVGNYYDWGITRFKVNESRQDTPNTVQDFTTTIAQVLIR